MKNFALLILIYISFCSLAKSNQLHYKDIVSIPDVSEVVLAPDGKHIAYTVRVDTETKQGVLVVLYNSVTGETKQLAFSENEKYVITDILWGNNDVLLVKAKFPAARYGTPTTETRLLKVDIHTGKMDGVLSRSFFNKMTYVSNILSTIVDILPEDDDHILMSLSGFNDGVGHSVVKVAITKKGKTKIIRRPKRKIIHWVTDAEHQVRIGLDLDETTYTVYELLEDGNLKKLWQFEAFSKEQIWPRGFGKDNNVLYVETLYEGKDAIFKVDLTDPKLEKELVFYHQERDVSGGLRRSKETREYVGIGYHYWDAKYKAFIKAIDKALPDTDNLLLDKSKDGNNYILFASSDNEPGMYLIGDRKNKTLELFAYKYQKLAPELLAKKEKISYLARDGLKIEGFLTYPQGNKKENLPTIIFPHGGPISYDDGGFDYWTQFFANKGYAVLQMNFRGSSGYGFNFMQQGLAAWGQAMQDDVEDGTRWLIKEGIANKDKICIIGASYGGYAALMGAIKTPELYQCVVSFAGVTDVEALVKAHRSYTNYDIVKKQIGDDFSKLWDVSPQKHADKIKAPVLLIHGTKDRVVRVEQSEDMFDELEDEDKQVEYLEIEKADHYLSNNEHRLQTFGAMDKFLNTFLPVN
ncbi:alpha/beta hydrolase family protein [Thalassotalea agariperforans]